MRGTLIHEKIASHRKFWNGEGPSLLLISPDSGPLYDTADYARRFADPQQMWESEIRRAQPILDWPTDGIPTVRPNLGVVFVPSIAGQGYELKDDQMPWPGEPLTLDTIRAARRAEVAESTLMRRAEAFYRIHREHGSADVAPYHADTQGIFDIAHLLYGDEILTSMAGTPAEQALVFELLEISLDLYLKATRRLKDLLGEGPLGVQSPITQYQNFEQLELAGQNKLAPGYEKLFKLISRVGREVTAPCA